MLLLFQVKHHHHHHQIPILRFFADRHHEKLEPVVVG
jgi:hypothetical protein